MDQPQDQPTAAYRAWMDHIGHNDRGERCQTCIDADAPHNGCEEGRELWGVYRLAKVATAVPVTDGS